MDAVEMVRELLEYFSGSYSPTLLRKINETCENIPSQDCRRVIEQIEEDNAPKFKLGVKQIADACKKLGIPFHRVEHSYVPAVDVTCDACGLGFKYAMCVSYSDEYDKGIFSTCPRCGFGPDVTMSAKEIARAHGGRFPKWYADRRDYFLERLHTRQDEETRKPAGTKRYKGWMFDKQEEDDFEARRRRDEVEAMKRAAADEVTRVAQKAKENGK